MNPGRYAIVYQLATCETWTWGQREYMARIALRLKPGSKVPQDVWDRIGQIADHLQAGRHGQAYQQITQLVDGDPK